MKPVIKKGILLVMLLAIALLFLVDNSVAYTAGEQPFMIKFDIPCPTFLGFGPCPTISQESPSIANYLIRLYRFALGIVGIIAVGAIVVGAIEYAISGGNPDHQRDAMSRITSALWGIALLIGAVLILNTINPRIAALEEPTPKTKISGISFTPFGIGGKSCNPAAIVYSYIPASGCNPDSGDDKFQECIGDKKEKINKTYAEALNDCTNRFPNGGAFFYNAKSLNPIPECLPFYQLENGALKRDKQGNPILQDYSKTDYKSC